MSDFAVGLPQYPGFSRLDLIEMQFGRMCDCRTCKGICRCRTIGSDMCVHCRDGLHDLGLAFDSIYNAWFQGMLSSGATSSHLDAAVFRRAVLEGA